MITERIGLLARKNVHDLALNAYPGRLIAMGMDETGQYAVQIYGITGRSEASQNRKLVAEGTCRVFTKVADPAKQSGDPALTIYNAMRESTVGGYFAVSNGSQTDTLMEGLSAGETLESALRGCKYEPDAPNFTPRICGLFSSGLSYKESPYFQLAMFSKSAENNSCVRDVWVYREIPNGFGYFISTYASDGNPLPAFKGEPLPVTVLGNIDEVAGEYWQALNKEKRVALAVKFISLKEGISQVKIVNRF